jgi:hypothetical protein
MSFVFSVGLTVYGLLKGHIEFNTIALFAGLAFGGKAVQSVSENLGGQNGTVTIPRFNASAKD